MLWPTAPSNTTATRAGRNVILESQLPDSPSIKMGYLER